MTMPLTSKGEEILANMKKQYGDKKGEEVFYASKNAGTISGVDSDERADADAAGKGYKKFPSYSLSELKKFAAEGVTPMRDAAKLEMIKQEIKDRESGESKQLKVPQVGWGKKDDANETSLQDRLDTMTQQVNSIGQVAAKVAGRMDSGIRFHLFFRYKNPERGHVNTGSATVYADNIEEAARQLMAERNISSIEIIKRLHINNGQVDQINKTFSR